MNKMQTRISDSARYETVDASSEAPDGLAAPSAWTTEGLEAWLLEHARIISSKSSIDPQADIFAQGFDRYVSRETMKCLTSYFFS